MRRLHWDWARVWASVLATRKSTPSRPASIMLLTALPPAPPTPSTVMRGRNSFDSGAFRLIAISFSSERGPVRPGLPCFDHLAAHQNSQLIRLLYFVESSEPSARQPAEPVFMLGSTCSDGDFRIKQLRRHGGASHQEANGGGIVRPSRRCG